MSRTKKEPGTFIVLNGINFPPRQRREPGETVEASELNERARAQLLERGHIAPLEAVTERAAELIGRYFQDGLRAASIKGSGRGGTVTKGDVERALAGVTG